MPSIFWTGRLTIPIKLMVNANNVLALLVGKATNTAVMKSRVRGGYEGRFSHHVEGYDQLGLSLQERSADVQLQGLQLVGQSVVDIGCGTCGVAAYDQDELDKFLGLDGKDEFVIYLAPVGKVGREQEE